MTEVSRLPVFYPAENIHQDYYAKFPEQGYCQVIINPKLAKARKYYSAWLMRSSGADPLVRLTKVFLPER